MPGKARTFERLAKPMESRQMKWQSLEFHVAWLVGMCVWLNRLFRFNIDFARRRSASLIKLNITHPEIWQLSFKDILILARLTRRNNKMEEKKCLFEEI